MSMIFSHPQFLETMADTVFAGRTTELGRIRTSGSMFDVLLVDGRPVVDAPGIDFLEPVPHGEGEAPGAGRGSARPWSYLPAVSCAEIPAEIWGEYAVSPAHRASPYIDWRCFDGLDEYLSRLSGRASQSFAAKALRRRRRLQRDHGEVAVSWGRADRGLLDQCLTWKSAQYRRSRYVDLFASPRHRRWFHALLDVGLLHVSALRAGGQVIAIQVGCRADGRYYDWVPSYDPNYRRYGPGTQLREAIIEHSFRNGDSSYELLIGAEGYKLEYATHVRLIAPLGRAPWPRRAWARARAPLMAFVRRSAKAHRILQDVKRSIQQRRLT